MPSSRNTLRLVQMLLLTFAIAVLVPPARGQIATVDDTTSTPIPGAGHDYIHLLSETVNPANGSVSLRIQFPTAAGRGIALPFSIGYDSTVLITYFLILPELWNRKLVPQHW